MPETFQEKFCRHFGVPPGRYATAVLHRTLYPHARGLFLLGARDAFATDRIFVAGVGRLTQRRGLAGEVQDFLHDPDNRGFWRRAVRLRVSVARMRALVATVWREPDPPPAAPEEKLRPEFQKRSY